MDEAVKGISDYIFFVKWNFKEKNEGFSKCTCIVSRIVLESVLSKSETKRFQIRKDLEPFFIRKEVSFSDDRKLIPYCIKLRKVEKEELL